MSPRRRSRFSNWTGGVDPGDETDEPEGDAVSGSDTPSGGDTVYGSDAVYSDADDSVPVVGQSLSDLLVGGDSLSEGADPVEPESTPGTELPYDGRIVRIPLDAVTPNAVQPRRRFEESSLAALTASVSELGVLQPIIVRPIAAPDVGDGANGGSAAGGVIDLRAAESATDSTRYELVAGERRWRAARRAGLNHIPALVREVDDLRSLEEAIVENLHRVDLNPLEEAGAFQQLVDDFGLTQEEVAARVGKSRSAVANTLRLLQLPGSIQRMVMDGELSAGHARTLLSEPSLARQRQLAARIIEDDLSVRQAEELAKELSGRRSANSDDGSGASRPSPTKSAGALEVENHLADVLDTRVRVTEGAKRGSITIEFADADDLDRIYRLFVGPRRRS